MTVIEKLVILKDYERDVKDLWVLVLVCLKLIENLEFCSFYADFLRGLLVFLYGWIEADFLSIFLKFSLVNIMPDC